MKSTELVLQLKDIEIIPSFNARFKIDPKNPKTIALAASIQAEGLLENLVVREDVIHEPGQPARCRYELIAGFRRYTAMTQILGWTEARCLIKVCSKLDAVVTNLVENLQREQLRPIEICEQCAVLQNLGMEPKKIADALGFSVTYVYQMLRVSKMHPKIMEDMRRADYGETMTMLITIAALDSDGQIEAWDAFLGRKEAKESEVKNGSEKPKVKVPKVVKREKIQKLLEVDLGRSDQLTPEQRKFAEKILKWVLGMTPNYPIKMPPEEHQREEEETHHVTQ